MSQAAAQPLRQLVTGGRAGNGPNPNAVDGVTGNGAVCHEGLKSLFGQMLCHGLGLFSILEARHLHNPAGVILMCAPGRARRRLGGFGRGRFGRLRPSLPLALLSGGGG